MKKSKKTYLLLILLPAAMAAGACGRAEDRPPVVVLEEKDGSAVKKGKSTAGRGAKVQNGEDEDDIYVPDKDTVLAARESALEGMDEEDISDLTETVKLANLRMEDLILNENLEKKLKDPESVYWELFEETGDIRIGWAFDKEQQEKRKEYKELSDEEFGEKFGQPVIRYNRFDGADFINVMEEWKEKVADGALKEDFAQMEALMESGVREHNAEDIMSVYRMLHDMDYFLLRYGPEDVGKYTKDASTVCKFYDALSIYKEQQ